MPGFLNNPRILDVTDEYVKAYDIEIPIKIHNKKEKYTYLTVSNRSNWDVIGWGDISDGQCRFKKVGINTVFLPVLLHQSGQEPVNYPFRVSTAGSIKFIKPDLKNTREVVLTHKYPILSPIIGHLNKMVDGKFQFANNSDFSDSITIHRIRETPSDYYNEVNLDKTKSYRYVRYIGPKGAQCNVAEIEFYDENGKNLVNGTPISSHRNFPGDQAFDGDLLTYYKGWWKIGWVGLDFGKPVRISKIRYVPRNGKNHVMPNHRYELFYWDNKWISLGQKVPSDPELVFNNVPSSCLLLLKNHTEGKEERIFTYEDEEQVWW